MSSGVIIIIPLFLCVVASQHRGSKGIHIGVGSTLLVQTNWAISGPQSVERATSTDSTLFLYVISYLIYICLTNIENFSCREEQETFWRKLLRVNMDLPLPFNDIGIHYVFKGYLRKSSTFNRKADVEGLSVYIDNLVRGGYFGQIEAIKK